MGTSGIDWQSAARTHIGNVRKLNEDALLDRPRLRLWAVADGMGGHEAGDVASRRIVEALDGLGPNDAPQSHEVAMCAALSRVNDDLRSMAQEKGPNTIIGSTIALLLGHEDRAVCLWAGDSRVYLQRDGELRQLTRDHSQVEDLVQRGAITRAEAESHPSANVITRAVGASDSIAIDRCEEPARSGDIYLLCSDGLNKTVPEREIRQILVSGSCLDAVRALLHLALVRGATDNLTAIVVHAS